MKLQERAWKIRQRFHPRRIRFYRPARTRPVSVTGRACSQDCAHCGGRHLMHMQGVEAALSAAPSASYLVSGGCDEAGRVPIAEHVDLLRALRERGRLNVHSGIVTEGDVAILRELDPVVSYDFVVHQPTITTVYGHGRTARDFLEGYRLLRSAGLRVVPHVLIGLNGGRIEGERAAVEALRELGCEELVFLVLIPTRGSRFATAQPPPPEEVAEVLCWARVTLPEADLQLGCMRPGGRYRRNLDPLAVRAGVNGIVKPDPAAVRAAEEVGLKIEWGEECCVF